VLQADGYAGFNRVYEKGVIQEAACWAHVRRKFYDLHQAHASPIAAEAMARIAHLYAIESEIRGRSSDERLAVRQTRARPLLESLHQWLETSLAKLSAKSETASAIRYALGRWPALMRYCEDGRIDKRAVEFFTGAFSFQRRLEPFNTRKTEKSNCPAGEQWQTVIGCRAMFGKIFRQILE
jgi:hypothetical protein